MKIIVIKLALVLLWGSPDKGPECSAEMHTKESGSLNLKTLNQIETLLTKKAGAELKEDNENLFTLNGYSVHTSVTVRKYAPDIYEESFYEIQNPNNEYRLRLTKHPNGDSILAILMKKNEETINYHAAFDSQGKMYEEDPWGIGKGYTIDIFKIYQKYLQIFSQKIDAK